MQNAIIKHFPRAIVRYEFIDRNDLTYPDGFDYLVREEINKMALLEPNPKHIRLFQNKTVSYMDPTYFIFLRGYMFDPNEVKVWLDENNKLKIVVEGPWYSTILSITS